MKRFLGALEALIPSGELDAEDGSAAMTAAREILRDEGAVDTASFSGSA